MILPPRLPGAARPRSVGLGPQPTGWRAFALGASGLVAIAAVCLFALARLGS